MICQDVMLIINWFSQNLMKEDGNTPRNTDIKLEVQRQSTKTQLNQNNGLYSRFNPFYSLNSQPSTQFFNCSSR